LQLLPNYRDGTQHNIVVSFVEIEAPMRNLHVETVRPILKAIREMRAIDIGYRSLTSPNYLDKIIEPHTLIFDGIRWHVCAYCYKNQAYRDFVLSRFNGEAIDEGEAKHSQQQDSDWQK
jgi:predicted DNA-binding transcriptional regulator YafY